MTRAEAMSLRKVIETAAASLDDKTASTAPELSCGMKYDGALIKAGTRINFGGKLFRAAVDLWDTAENTPDKAETLWEEVAYCDGIRIIPNVLTAGTAFSKGEKGWWGDKLYISLLDSNVWTPDTYPAGWEAKA